jgi:hypothetical protein
MWAITDFAAAPANHGADLPIQTSPSLGTTTGSGRQSSQKLNERRTLKVFKAPKLPSLPVQKEQHRASTAIQVDQQSKSLTQGKEKENNSKALLTNGQTHQQASCRQLQVSFSSRAPMATSVHMLWNNSSRTATVSALQFGLREQLKRWSKFMPDMRPI